MIIIKYILKGMLEGPLSHGLKMDCKSSMRLSGQYLTFIRRLCKTLVISFKTDCDRSRVEVTYVKGFAER